MRVTPVALFALLFAACSGSSSTVTESAQTDPYGCLPPSISQGTPFAPLLCRLTGTPIAGLTGETEATVERAESALAGGEALAALELLNQAIDGLPADAARCDALANLHYAAFQVGALAGSSNSDHIDAAEQACPAAIEGDAAYQPTALARYFESVRFLEHNRGKAGPLMTRPRRWLTESDRAAYRAALEDIPGLSAYQRELLDTLMTQVEVAAAPEPSACADDGADEWEAEEAAVAARLDALGRHDLTMWGRIRAVTAVERAVDPVALAEFLDWLDAPDQAWLREWTHGRLLSSAAMQARAGVDGHALRPVCAMHYEALERDVTVDRAEGAGGRNVSRLIDGALVLAACPSQSLAPLVESAMTAANLSEDGPSQLLTLVVGLGGQLFVQALGGQFDAVFATLSSTASAIERVRPQLGDDPADRMIDLTLGMLQAALTQTDLAVSFQEAKRGFAQLAVDVPPDQRDEFVQLLPLFRLATFALDNVTQVMNEGTVDVDVQLAALDEIVASELAAALASLEQPDHSEAILGLASALAETAVALDDPSTENLGRALRAAELVDAAGPDEAGYWAIGLELARVAIWDLYGLAAAGGGQSDQQAAAMARAQAVVERMVGPTLSHFSVEGTGWEVAHLLPAIHRMVVALVGGAEMRDALAIVATDLDQALANAMESVSGDLLSPQPGQGGWANALLRILAEAAEIGAQELAREDLGGLLTLARAVGEHGRDFQPEIRGYIEIGVAYGRFLEDPASAHDAFVQASGSLAGSLLDDVAYLPSLLEAHLWISQADDPATALERLDVALAAGDEALSCGQAHAVHGLLPVKAWLLERLDRHAEADAELADYFVLVDGGFSGEGRIDCQVLSHQGSLLANGTFAQTMANLFFPTALEGTFQVGLGIDGSALQDERVVCAATAVQGMRRERPMMAALARAAYAYRAGDDRTAQIAALRALSEGRLMLHGAHPIVSRADVSALATSAQRVHLPLLGVVASLADSRGQVHLAADLRALALSIFDYQRAESPMALISDGLPPYLEGLTELEPFVLHYDAALQMQQDFDLDAYLTFLHGFEGASPLSHEWSFAMQEAVAVGGRDLEAAVAMLSVQDTPDDSAGAAALAALHTLFGMQAGQTIDFEHAVELVVQLSAQGYYDELQGLMNTVIPAVLATGNVEAGVQLTQLVEQAVPSDVALARADLMSALLPIVTAYGHPDTIRAVLEEVIQARHARVPPNAEIEQRLTLVNVVGQLEDYDALVEEIDALLPMLRGAVPPDDPFLFRLQAVKVAVDAMRDGVTQAQIDHLVYASQQVNQLVAEDTGFIDALRSGDDLAEVSLGYLRLLLGVSQQPVDE